MNEIIKLEHAQFLQGKILKSYSGLFYDVNKNTIRTSPDENSILAPNINEARHLLEIKYNIRIYPLYNHENEIYNVNIYTKSNEEIELITRSNTFMEAFDKGFDFIIKYLIK